MPISLKKSQGFTIIELLIVIVIIAILAAVTLVAYNGIQGRAYDAIVRQDIENFVKAIRIYEVQQGTLPVAGSVAVSNGGFGNSTMFAVNFRPTKSAYRTDMDNFFYCSGTKGGVSTFMITVAGKSGYYVYTPENGLQTLGTSGLYTTCVSGWDGTAGQNYGYSYGFYATQQTWWSWTN